MIAVIGATGFTGHRVVRELRETYRDEVIVAVVRTSSSHARLSGVDVEYRIADLADATTLKVALRGADRIVCTASLGFGHAPNLCAAISAEDRQHAVLFSTTSVFTKVPNATREVRVRAEHAIRSSGIPSTILRPTMIYGRAGDRNIERLLHFLRRSPVMPAVEHGRALQQPVFVDDLAKAVVQVLQSRATTIGREYNLPGARAVSFTQLVRLAGRAVGRRPYVVPVPARAAFLFASAWRRTGLPPFVSEEQVLRILEDKVASWDRAREDFGYAPRGFDQGVVAEARALGMFAPRERSGGGDGPTTALVPPM